MNDDELREIREIRDDLRSGQVSGRLNREAWLRIKGNADRLDRLAQRLEERRQLQEQRA